ncbi:type II toxin-antitoxin system VapB family antitoxin [uncultured Sphingomonas sp.]|uniref:type II toxin-antitoxin system VapB family antitoxin n=1 Tax=uncultured Sphingomonas sp. TaxID=158754 RepID=UPI0035C973F5
MASLYIKDSETAALASEIAGKLGKTKTEIVRELLRAKKAELEVLEPKANLVEWMEEYHRTHPRLEPTGLKADKAFFDWLSGEEDVDDPFH